MLLRVISRGLLAAACVACGTTTRTNTETAAGTNAETAATGLNVFTAADVQFMQGMLPHHAQALVMTDLVDGRTENAGIRQLALRIEISQRDEIARMERWLKSRGQPLPHGHHGGMLMPGMLTEEQLTRLRAARGSEFDRLFLELMIQHHEGALVMVDQLFSTGGGQEAEIFVFASHVDGDQRAEIARMRALLSAMEPEGGMD